MATRCTRTHSGPDSKGVVRFGRWELEGEAYLFIVGGAVCAVLIFILAVSLPFPARVSVTALPLLAAAAWVKFFLVGRPPHFTGDFLEGLVVGRHFDLGSALRARKPHPRAADASRDPDSGGRT